MKEMAQIFRLGPVKRIRYVVIPQLVPYIMSAARVTVGMAWKAGVAAEIIGTPAGSMGKALFLAKMYLDTDDLLAWTVIIVFVSVACEKLFLMALSWILKAEDRL